MSLSTRVIAALGAVVVIGAGTVGLSVAHANDKGKPDEHLATLTVGRSSIHSAPLCYNDGKALSEEAQAKCQALAKQKEADGSLPTSDVVASDQIGVGVEPGVADKGWFAFTNGGTQGQATLASARKGSTYSGSVAATSVLNAGEKTTVTVVEADQKTQDIIGVWYFQLKNKDAVTAAAK